MTDPPATPPESVPAPRPAMLIGGQEVYGIGTIEKLYAQHFPDMLFISFGPGPMADWLDERGIDHHRHQGLRSFKARGSLATLAAVPGALRQASRDAAALAPLLRERGVAVVHTHWLPQQLVAGQLRKHGFKSFWQINNNSNPRRLLGLGTRLNHRMARWGADMLLPASDFIARNWAGCGVPLRTIRNAAAPVHDQPPPGSAGPALRCLTAGRMTPQKGHHLAVQAVVRARNAGLDVRLDCFGGVNDDEQRAYDAELKRLAGPHFHDDAIRLMGLCHDLRQRHRDYHLGLQVRTDPEPCSLWVCETLVDGLPLLASATGGTPELVDDPHTGLLFPTGDVNAITRHLQTLASDRDRLNRMAQAAWQRGLRHFRAERMMRETAAAYASV